MGALHLADTVLRAVQRVQAAEAAANEAGQQAQQDVGPAELEPWLMDFAGLFQDQMGINSEAHVNLSSYVSGPRAWPCPTSPGAGHAACQHEGRCTGCAL